MNVEQFQTSSNYLSVHGYEIERRRSINFADIWKMAIVIDERYSGAANTRGPK